MAAQQKDIIYIDIDDEITSIIDKVRSSDSRIVALVLPKRATMLQSIVNMKLLKRTADTAKKHIVLITSESGLLPLAGAVSLHVAKNLQSKPLIPSGPEAGDADDAEVGEDELATGADEPDLDESKSVGELAGTTRKSARTTAAARPVSPDDDAIELDNSDDIADHDALVLDKSAKKKGGSKFKIPNFEKFRLLVILGGIGFVALLAGLYLAIFVMPKAKITIKTDSTTVNSNITFTASTTTKELDEEGRVLPAQRQENKKTDTEKAPATGQKDIGTKASGNVTFSNCSDSPVTVPAGTGISNGNLTFITQEAVSLDAGNFNSNGSCKTSGPHVSSGRVVAQNNGDQYNLSARDYTVAGYSSVKASGQAMSGGTSKIVKVVAQADVDAAKEKLATKASQSASDELKQALKAKGLYPLTDTLNTGDPVTTITPQVGEEASEVTVSTVTATTMLAINEEDLKKLVEEDAKKQIDTSKQSILDNGLSEASFVVQGSKTAAQVKLTVQSLVRAGPQLDNAGIKREIAGKKKGETISIIQNRPAIKDVTVEYSPFWVSKTPKKQNKITIVFDQSSADAKKP